MQDDNDFKDEIRRIVSDRQREPAPNDFLKSWAIPIAITVIGWLVLYFNSFGEMRTLVEQIKVRQEGVISRLGAIEAWRESTQSNRFTAQEGAALRSSMEAHAAADESRNVQQDARMASFTANFGTRLQKLEERIALVERYFDMVPAEAPTPQRTPQRPSAPRVAVPPTTPQQGDDLDRRK